MKVQRYDPKYRPFSKGLERDDLGNWVKYSDYEKLESENEELLEAHEYTKQQNVDVHNEWKELNDKNKELRDDLNKIDHSEACMCRICNPEFNELRNG